MKALEKYNKRIQNSNKEVLSSAFQAMLRIKMTLKKLLCPSLLNGLRNSNRGGLSTASDDFFY